MRIFCRVSITGSYATHVCNADHIHYFKRPSHLSLVLSEVHLTAFAPNPQGVHRGATRATSSFLKTPSTTLLVVSTLLLVMEPAVRAGRLCNIPVGSAVQFSTSLTLPVPTVFKPGGSGGFTQFIGSGNGVTAVGFSCRLQSAAGSAAGFSYRLQLQEELMR